MLLDERQRMVRDLARDFAASEIAPHARAWEGAGAVPEPVLQKMGELYQKKNDNVQAAHFFTKVAESYSSDGFFLKAVALYKQVLKLNPTLIDVNLKLAELHQQLQLMSEAMAYYQLVASHYDKAGDTRASLDTAAGDPTAMTSESAAG
jgi:tetratricopeptide (TPR) repeat protein